MRTMLLGLAIICAQLGGITPLLAKSTPTCGYAALYPLKYKNDSTAFNYVNKNAVKGGKLRLARVGTYDSLNFLRYPGTTITDRKQIPLYMADYLFDSLLTQSADEPASYYCLVAKSIRVARDLKTVTFELNENARFHDGKPITAKDVLFTFNTLKKQGPPYYRQVLKNFTAKNGPENSLVFQNNGRPDREFVRKVGTLPIHPAHARSKKDVTQKSMDLPLGSGPYRITSAAAGKTAHLKRVQNYWANDHFTRKGRFNFDEIIIDYYRDKRTALEAYKVGKYDIRLEDNPLSWAKEYEGAAKGSGEIVKITRPASETGDLYLLAFNHRREIFKDRRVREAFALLYDFKSANRILYHGLYNPVRSIYGDTRLGAKGPATEAEKALLGPHLANLPKGLLENDGPAPQWAAMSSREKIRRASKLLDEAGLVVKNNKRVDPKTGKPLNLTVSYLQPEHSRILMLYEKSLKTIGIDLFAPNLEPMTASKKALAHEFDMIIIKWTPEFQAGTTEYLLWSGPAAKHGAAYAFAGVSDPALDHTIFAMNKARTAAALETATKSFDRIFRWQIHAIPLWHQPEKWVSYRKGLKQPEKAPEVLFSIIDSWWFAPKSHAQK